MRADRSAELPVAGIEAPRPFFPGLRAIQLDPAVTLCACLIFAVLSRLHGATITYTSDEGYWMQRTARFGAALVRGDLAMTNRSGHPGVTVMWAGLVGLGSDGLTRFLPQRYAAHPVLQKDSHYLVALASARHAMIVAVSLLMVVVVGLAWRLLGGPAALLGGFLLLLDPYVIGMTRLLHVDALLAPLMAVSALAALIWWRGGHWGYLVLSSVAGGLALLTKAPAAYLAIFYGAIGLLTAAGWRAPRRIVLSCLVWAVLAGAVYVLVWPAMWIDPIGVAGAVVAFVLREGGQPHNWSSFFLGAPTTADPGLFFYPVALAYRLGPIVLGGLLVAMVGGWKRASDRVALTALGGYVLGFMIAMTFGGKKFDRYMLPAIVVLDLLAGVGLWILIRRVRRIGPRRAIVVLTVASQGLLLGTAYPYPIAAYNPLLGAGAGAQRVMMVGWGEGLEQVAAYLNRQPNSDRLVASTLYHHALRPLFRGQTVRIVEPVSPDFFVVYVNMAQRDLIPPGIRLLIAGRLPDFTARVHGVDYAWVYRLPPGISTTPPGQAPESLPDEVPDDEQP